MGEPERLPLLKACLAQYLRLLQSVTVRLPAAGPVERATLLAQRATLARKIEHSQIEISFAEDADGLIALYTHQHRMADTHARAAHRPDSRGAFKTRARLCEEIVLEAIERRGTSCRGAYTPGPRGCAAMGRAAWARGVPAAPSASAVLAGVRADLERAARETAPTVISVDRATGLVNGALDTLLVLVRVAVRIAA